MDKCINCRDTGRKHLNTTSDGTRIFSDYLDCTHCNAAVERAEFNKRLKEAGSMSVEDAAWWGYMQADKEKAA